MSFPILTVIALLPFVGGVITMMLRGAAARATGMVFSLVTLVLGVYAFIVGVNGTHPFGNPSLDPRCRSLVCARW